MARPRPTAVTGASRPDPRPPRDAKAHGLASLVRTLLLPRRRRHAASADDVTSSAERRSPMRTNYWGLVVGLSLLCLSPVLAWSSPLEPPRNVNAEPSTPRSVELTNRAASAEI